MTLSPRTPHVLKTCPLLVSGLGVELFGGLCSPHHTCPFPLRGEPLRPPSWPSPAQAPGRRGRGLSGLWEWRLRRWQVGRVTGKQKKQGPQTLGGVFGASVVPVAHPCSRPCGSVLSRPVPVLGAWASLLTSPPPPGSSLHGSPHVLGVKTLGAGASVVEIQRVQKRRNCLILFY